MSGLKCLHWIGECIFGGLCLEGTLLDLMCCREYTGWPKSRFTKFTLVLIIVFSVHKIVNLLYPSWCCPVMAGIEGPDGSEGWKDSFVLGCCGDWAEFCCRGTGACLPCRRNWGSEGFVFLLPEWQRNPVNLCIFSEKHFPCISFA